MNTTTLVVNPDESIMIGSNSIPESNNEQVEDIRIIEDVHNVYVPYGLLLCILIDMSICVYIFTYHKYYINSALLFLIINITLYGIYNTKIWPIKLYCTYHFMSIIFSGIYTNIIQIILYSVYHILCFYQGITCLKAFKMILSNNRNIAV